MSLNLGKIHDFIVKELVAERSIRDSMERVIARCAKGHPHDDWDELRQLKYEDLDHLRRWIKKPFRLDVPTARLKGLWFGLHNPMVKGKPAADIYVCGSTRFDANPLDNSWAVRPKWWPNYRYAQSPLLTHLYQIAYQENGLGNDAEYPLCLAYGGLAIRDLLREGEPSDFLRSSPSLGVAVGFDSGDFVLVGRLGRKGLVALSK